MKIVTTIFITIISLFILFIIILFFCSSVEAAFLWGGSP